MNWDAETWGDQAHETTEWSELRGLSIFLSAAFGPWVIAFALSWVWINVLHQELYSYLASDQVPYLLARNVTCIWFMTVGVAVIAAGAWCGFVAWRNAP